VTRFAVALTGMRMRSASITARPLAFRFSMPVASKARDVALMS